MRYAVFYLFGLLACVTPRSYHELHLSDGKLLTAASAIVAYKGEFYIVPDNSKKIYRTTAGDFDSLVPVEALPGSKDSDRKKKNKPDFEAAMTIDLDGKGEGILVVPSGSKPNRVHGAFLRLNDAGQMERQRVEFAKLYQFIASKVKELNIEGACLFENNLVLFQRGNGADATTAMIFLDPALAFTSPERALRKIVTVDLGKVGGVSFGFTDALCEQNTIYFLAAAEASKDAVEDGAILGSKIGIIDRSGNIVRSKHLGRDLKAEGLAIVAKSGDIVEFYIVSDPDNDDVASGLHRINF